MPHDAPCTDANQLKTPIRAEAHTYLLRVVSSGLPPIYHEGAHRVLTDQDPTGVSSPFLWAHHWGHVDGDRGINTGVEGSESG